MSGLCNVKRLLSKGIKVGLGTDVAGGQSVSMLDTMRSALTVSSHLELTENNCENKPVNYVDMFHLATIGGAKCKYLNLNNSNCFINLKIIIPLYF